MRIMYHFTDTKGYNGIRASCPWRFRASQPPGDHPVGAYFTTLPPGTPNLAKRLGIPKSKLEYVFAFTDAGDLTPLPGGRGEFIFYYPEDYPVEEARQIYHGKSEDYS
ncbi:MAG: hypothetical protein HYS12_06945 [Planctomycetes bacterium]|nr:hypothetical protein [Planctomycetota bacterium]